MTLSSIDTLEIRNVLAKDPQQSNAPDITTAEEWAAKRAVLKSTLWDLLGTSSNDIIPAPQYTVLEETENVGYRQLKISYLSEPDEEVSAWLLIPHRHNGASVLCLHGTADIGKDTQIGLSPKPGRDWARFLAQHGFITIAPDHICSGERLVEGEKPYDTRTFYARHPNWSAAGKAVWDGSRALDILETVSGVDKNRIGCIGHSLGGHGTMWVAAFDERVQAAIYSCGLFSLQDNPRRYEFSRDHWYVYIPKLRAIFDKQKETDGLLPVEMYEFAALIAPRPFLNISGMTDTTYGNNETLPAIGLQLNALWDLLRKPEQFAQFLPGMPHDVNHYTRLLSLGWLENWLVG
jgi:cephalosporin-C deacetylase-like acetyl esterase